MKKYKAIAFDLDDTLLDTSRLLVPLASRDACLAMIQEGLQCDLESCTRMREDLASQFSHPEIFNRIAQTFGCTNEAAAVQKAIQTFYNPQIAEQLPLLEGAEENLRTLQKNYRLFLVTMGNPTAQKAKIQALRISPYFTGIYIVDGLQGERKESVFKKILDQEKLQPHELLSIGNRLSSEIRDAKKCGCDTCYFAYGEHVGEEPKTSFDQPDVTIYQHKELINACAL